MSKRVFSGSDDELLVQMVSLKRYLYDRDHDDFRNNSLKNTEWNKIGDALGKDVELCRKRWKDIRDNYSKILRREDSTNSQTIASISHKWPLFHKLHFLRGVHRKRATYNITPKDYSNITSEDVSFATSQTVTFTDGVSIALGVIPHLHDSVDPLVIENGHFTHQFLARTMESPSGTAEALSTPKREPVEVLEDNSSEDVFEDNSSEDVFQENTKRRPMEVLQLQEVVHKSSAPEEETDVDMFMKSIAMTVKSLPPHVIPVAKMEILSIVNRLQLQYPCSK